MSNHDYHAQRESISKSGLDLIRKAPAIYQWRRDNPSLPTPAMRMGTLVHTAILEPDTLMGGLMVAPKIDRRTSAGKAEWEAFLIASEGKELVTVEELDQLMGIRDAVWAHPTIAQALRMLSEVESSVFWTDDDLGVACRCRPDGIMSNGVILDIKTTKDASPDAFAKSIANYRYHVQAAYYGDGYKAGFGEAPKKFAFIAIETEPPYLCAMYVASEAMVLRGRSDYRQDLLTYAECLRTDTWPGLPEAPTVLDLPKWA